MPLLTALILLLSPQTPDGSAEQQAVLDQTYCEDTGGYWNLYSNPERTEFWYECDYPTDADTYSDLD